MECKNQFIEAWIDEVHVNEYCVINRAKEFDQPLNKAWRSLESLLLLKAISLIDLTTLSGDDTISNVSSLVYKALHPLSTDLVFKILNSTIVQLQKINSVQLQEKPKLSINFIKTEDRKYILRIDHNDDIQNTQFADLTREELLELKQLLCILNLDSDDINKSLTTFLSLNNKFIGLEKDLKNTVRTAAICVYPCFVYAVQNILNNRGLNENLNANSKNIDNSNQKTTDYINIASVAAGFPSGLYDIRSKISEITCAINSGATEIDIVISRYLVIGHRWNELFDEIRVLKQACGKAKMKTILAVGECGSLENIYKASMVAMMAGSDFIKTSTGKENVNATFSSGLVMCRAINNFFIKTNKKIGFKPAGGIRTSDDALKWMRLVLTELGPDWLPLFRIGASGVIGSIEQRLKKLND